jgi:hypothetical protein
MLGLDWVQWYAATILVLGVLVGVKMHGRPKPEDWEEKYFRIGTFLRHLVLAMPMYGRIFGWW